MAEASVSITNSSSKLGNAITGADTTAFFIFGRLLWLFGSNWRSSSLRNQLGDVFVAFKLLDWISCKPTNPSFNFLELSWYPFNRYDMVQSFHVSGVESSKVHFLILADRILDLNSSEVVSEMVWMHMWWCKWGENQYEFPQIRLEYIIHKYLKCWSCIG